MYINYYKTYLHTIANSIGTKMYSEFFVDETDILHKGQVSCAYFVSNILKQFNLTPVGRANVPRVIEDLLQKGRTKLPLDTKPENIPAGSVLAREGSYGETYQKMHYHIGFYIGDEKAVSNNSVHFTGDTSSGLVPVEHHYTYNNSRQLTHILTRDRNNLFADWLYQYDIGLPFIAARGEEDFLKHGLDSVEAAFWSGKDEGMQYGKLCGVAAVATAVEYITTQPVSLKECIVYADQTISYDHPTTHETKEVTCYVAGIGRYHSGLIHIAQEIAKKHDTQLTGNIASCESQDILGHIQQMIRDNMQGKKSVLITSVTLGFDTTKSPKGGHLVTIAGLGFNGYETTVIIHDSIQSGKVTLPLSQFIDSFSGKFLVIEKI